MKNKTPRIRPHLKIYMGLFLFYWATWKCFMVNLCDTQRGDHFWGGVWPLDSSNTSPVSLSLAKITALWSGRSQNWAVASLSRGWGVMDSSNGVRDIGGILCSKELTFMGGDRLLLMINGWKNIVLFTCIISKFYICYVMTLIFTVNENCLEQITNLLLILRLF